MSDFTTHRLNDFLSAGTVFEVHISAPAYVRLVDYQNFHRYRMGRSYSYWGGRSSRSQFKFRLPESGRYLIIVDTVGLATKTKIRSTIYVLGSKYNVDKNISDKVVELPLRTVKG